VWEKLVGFRLYWDGQLAHPLCCAALRVPASPLKGEERKEVSFELNKLLFDEIKKQIDFNLCSSLSIIKAAK
jgi:hypothetical protein